MTPLGEGSHPYRADRQEEILRAALRQSRLSLGLSALLFLGFVGGMAYAYYAAEKGLAGEEDRVVKAARERLARHMDDIVAEAGDLAAETAPPVADAFYERLQADLPAYARAVDTQGQELIDSLEESLTRKAKAHSRKFLDRNRKVLEEEFPEVTDRSLIDRMLGEFERVFDGLGRRYYAREFRAEAEGALKAWRAIPPAPRPKPGQPSLGEQLVDSLGDWADRELTQPRPAAPPGSGGS
jgi:hypothetical protein